MHVHFLLAKKQKWTRKKRPSSSSQTPNKAQLINIEISGVITIQLNASAHPNRATWISSLHFLLSSLNSPSQQPHLHVSTAVPSSAMVRASRASRMMATGRIRACGRPLAIMIYMVTSDPEQHQESNKEENDIHNPKRKAGLQHRARLIQMHRKRIHHSPGHVQKTQVNLPRRRILGSPARAVILGDKP